MRQSGRSGISEFFRAPRLGHGGRRRTREQSGGCVMSEAARVSELKAAPKREY